MKAKKRKRTVLKRNGFSVLTVFLFIVLCIVGYWTYKSIDFTFLLRQYGKPGVNPTGKPTPTPTPIILIQGKETYSVSQSAHKGPTISQVVFDPLDVRKGQTLTLEVTITDTAPVTEVKASLQMDGSTQEFTLTKSDQKNVWVGTIEPNDTLWYTYALTITAKSTNGTSRATVAPRS